jgi:hypothetical protein
VIPSSQEHLAYTCAGNRCKVIIFIVCAGNGCKVIIFIVSSPPEYAFP